jgi:anti-sigma B factor antagonist
MLWKRSGETSNPDAINEPEPPPLLTIEAHELDGRTCVILTGELDGASAPSLRESLTAFMGELARDLVLDIGELSFIDSSGLALFVEVHKTLDETGHRLTLLHPSPMACRILAIGGLNRYLRIEST